MSLICSGCFITTTAPELYLTGMVFHDVTRLLGSKYKSQHVLKRHIVWTISVCNKKKYINTIWWMSCERCCLTSTRSKIAGGFGVFLCGVCMCAPCMCVGFLQVLQFPSIVKKTCMFRTTGDSKLHLCLCVCVHVLSNGSGCIPSSKCLQNLSVQSR